MYDSGKIIAGLIIFVGLFTSPFWYDTSNGKALERPQLVLPSNPNQQVCVADSTFMRCDHMVLLNDWRYQVVREGKTDYMSNTGREFEMRYTKTCLGCHPNTSQFCDQCH
ncbi:MAG TPA: sulfate reduction electron transfer complex DsrMKJOP subunit DsrJ, partial [Candidatus Kryptobacter bacterium]|nr:sulfate reduction electron transfer complex DsrMKJOP subunit DsrJ [Candidatus Kryptobacter bacterium]